MSSRLTRPRRTRLYDAAYRAGESYYKPTLDNLDRRRFGRTESPSLSTPTRIKFDLDQNTDEDLSNARARAYRAITEEPSLFDSRGQRVARSQMRSAIANSSAYVDDEELGEEIQSSLSRIRANRQKMSSLMNDLDLDDTFSTIKRRANMDLGEKLMNINKSGEDDYGIKARGIKLVSGINEVDTEFEPEFKCRTKKLIDRLGDDVGSGELDSTRRSAIQSFRKTIVTSDETSSSSHSAAAERALQSKARLANLETDIFDRKEKLLNHEARSARLRNFMADNEIECVKKAVAAAADM